MSLENRLSRLPISGTRVWLILIIVVFIVLSFVYDALVSPKEGQENVFSKETSALPQGNISKLNINLQPAEEKQETQEATPLVTTDPIEGIGASALPPVIEHVIKPGDTLAKIFSQLGLPRQDMYTILEADEQYLVLDPLMPGDTLSFELDKTGNLQSLSIQIDVSKTVSYVSHDNGGFVYEEHIKPIRYSQSALHGTIKGSFYLSAKKLGLSDAQIATISNVLGGRIDFRKDLRAGDEFDVVLQSGDVDGVEVGMPQLEALQISVKGQIHQAFLHSDGRYYDHDGHSLTPALLRWPTSKHYRVSSPFNPNRLHPITGRPSPHNGVDLAAPVGTKVLATGDGVVTRVATHKYAGKYLDINNLGPYSTRFLHLSKILVKNGQHVKRGQVIALSGNTGRTTGAHLHYELHINGKPVDPMTAKIPTTQSIAKSEMSAYRSNVERWTAMMNDMPY